MIHLLKMFKFKKILPAVFFLIISSSLAGVTHKIMPVGDSITAGEHYKFPALEERTGYRKALYEMLIKAGYKVDFVGSQNHGIRPEGSTNWYDWNNEAYPGWKIPGIATQVKTSLTTNEPDILLVHVGTNGTDWGDKPNQVKSMLDMINSNSVASNRPMTVFLCLIINRYLGADANTTQFNGNVANMVSARTGDKIKIILVDMEKGAGLDYSDTPPNPNANPPYEGGDMWGNTYPGMTTTDLYHPNDKGNTKMAVKFYPALVKEIEPNADFDGDGFTNLEEYMADTDPTNNLSRLRMTGVTRLPGGVKVDWQGGIRATQFLQRANNLNTNLWLNISTRFPPTSISGSHTDVSATNNIQFYRIKVAR